MKLPRSTGPVHEPAVPVPALSSCSTNVAEDDATTHLPTVQREAFPQQNVHQAVLAPNSQHTAQNSDESVVPVAGGRTKDYCDWWREKCSEQSDLSLFNVRLIGDASSPQLFTSMAHNDLAYCRYACFWTAFVQVLAAIHKCGSILYEEIRLKECCNNFCSQWGHNRVLERNATLVPIILVLPVLTKPEVVEQAVAGILSGQISLSLSNVEAILVLANAVGVSQLTL